MIENNIVVLKILQIDFIIQHLVIYSANVLGRIFIPLHQARAAADRVTGSQIPSESVQWEIHMKKKGEVQLSLFGLGYVLLFFSFKFFILFLNFTNCISFAKYQNESATGICASYEVLPGRESFRE